MRPATQGSTAAYGFRRSCRSFVGLWVCVRKLVAVASFDTCLLLLYQARVPALPCLRGPLSLAPSPLPTSTMRLSVRSTIRYALTRTRIGRHDQLTDVRVQDGSHCRKRCLGVSAVHLPSPPLPPSLPHVLYFRLVQWHESG